MPSARLWPRAARVVLSAAALLLGAGGIVGCARQGTPPGTASAATGAATYVGAATCGGCHAPESAAWAGSHHAKAMQDATPATVLADFGDGQGDVQVPGARFRRRDGHFYVTTDGADGKPAEFELSHTFGVYPLQQYLVAFPDGRRQALSFAWDARPRTAGGQRWFDLYPDSHRKPNDPLHWTRAAQNWNSGCAECHSTNLRRGYDAAADRYQTTSTDLSVGCESCHGPGSGHVAWANAPLSSPARAGDASRGLAVRFPARATWQPDETTGAARRAVPLPSAVELEACATCHARRAQFAEGHVAGTPLTDTHLPALLRAGLYEANGQMQDEVYNYGSFLQSKMHSKGVSCGDCHEPHAQTLRAPGNAVCTQCHAARYDTVAHSHHPSGSAGAQCAACHMPVRTYMGVHQRHDHGFRVPRPDQAAALGSRDACTDCHVKKSPAWAARAIEQWFGPTREGFQTFGPAFAAARAQSVEARAKLTAVITDEAQPAIVRGTALAELAPYVTPADYPMIRRALTDPDPLVRVGALQSLESLPLENRFAAAGDLVRDSSPAVRLLAVPFLLPAEPDAAHRESYATALHDYVMLQEGNRDRPASRVNLALVASRQGDVAGATKQYEAALKLDPSYTPARVNLADLYRNSGREPDAEQLLRDGLLIRPDDAVLVHGVGLSLVRQHRLDDAMRYLKRAAELAPESARYGYVYGVALDSAGQRPAAVATLRDNVKRHPADRDSLIALVTLLRDAGDTNAAIGYVGTLAKLLPGDPRVAELALSLQR